MAGLTALKTLDLSNNQISSVSSLSELTKLETLFLGANSISDVSPLSGLTALTSMSLDDNNVSDISPLSGLSNLEHLVLHGNPIRDVTPVSFVSSLLYDEFTEPQPAQPQPAESQSPQDSGALAALAGYAGTFTPYEAFSGSYGGGSKFRDVTLNAQGVVTGGGTDWYSINCHGQQPSSVTQSANGSIVLTYSAYELFSSHRTDTRKCKHGAPQMRSAAWFCWETT